MHETIFFKRPKFLEATSNLCVEQNFVHLGRFLHFNQKVIGVTLIRFTCFQAIFSCRSNADVLTRLNVHMRSVIRKTLKLTKTALNNDTFNAIV